MNARLLLPALVLLSGCGSGASAGKVSGMADGVTPFGEVHSALWIGKPDSASETVLYLFSKPVSCAELQTAGWDARIPLDAQLFEVVAKNTEAGDYPVKNAAVQATEGEVVHTLSRTGAELKATSGTLSLSTLDARRGASGTFDVAFPGGATTASFHSEYCPNGVEP